MKRYRQYMERQTISEEGHRALLELGEVGKGERKKRRKSTMMMQFGALAACAALAVGLGGTMWNARQDTIPLDSNYPDATAIVESFNPKVPENWKAMVESFNPSAVVNADNGVKEDVSDSSFVATGPADDAKLMFPNIFSVKFDDANDANQAEACISLPDGSFSVKLGKEEIQKLFWGANGKPTYENPKADPGDFPLMLMNWNGYTISGEVIYDGNGDLWQLRLQGEKGKNTFTLTASVDRYPLTDTIIDGGTVTKIHDVDVTGWYRSYDRDGDGHLDHVMTSKFMSGNVGIYFENVGGEAWTDAVDGDFANDGSSLTEAQRKERNEAALFHDMVVTQLIRSDGEVYLDHLLHTDDIPVWRSEVFQTLEEARAETAYTRYLPAKGPEGFGEFYGRLNYQEGIRNELWVRWSKIGGYDDVEIAAYLPEGEGMISVSEPVNVSVRESYDWRLYDGAICDVVPEEFQLDFYKPVFRAEDISLEVVRAREHTKDTGGSSFDFYVLHQDGTVVGYSASGVSAEYVWSLVEHTLTA